MNSIKPSKKLLFLLFLPFLAIYFQACSDNVTNDNQTDDEYIKGVIMNGYSGHGSNAEDDDIFGSEASDLDDGGAVGGFAGETPIDSLIRWGRRITSVSKTVTITNEGDSIKNADITTTINGNFMIIGVVAGNIDTIVKPYTEVIRRKAIFKKADNPVTPHHRWRLYKVSMADGGTTAPQNSEQYIQMQQIQVYVNNVLTYTLTGPDFTQNIFTTIRFGGAGIPEVNIGDQVKLVVNTYSAQTEQDIVAWHWGKRCLGFHREPFAMTSQTANGTGWDRVYEKTFTIQGAHYRGRFNGFVSASTHNSLYDDSPTEFSSDLVGTPYRVRP